MEERYDDAWRDLTAAAACRRPEDDPLVVYAFAPQSAAALASQYTNIAFPLDSVRLVQPQAKGGRFKAEPLLQADTLGGQLPPVWKETNIKGLKSSMAFFRQLQREKVLGNRLSREPLGVAVTVASDAGKPRMVVFGDADFLNNASQGQTELARAYYSLFLGALDWMTERENVGGLTPKETTTYTLPRGVNESRLIFLPTWLMMLGIVGLGAGIWVVRRR
jgi:hypothetical protein